MKPGDLVWCQNGIRKNMGIIECYDPSLSPDDTREHGPESYVWVILIEHDVGQKKWAKIKNLIRVRS